MERTNMKTTFKRGIISKKCKNMLHYKILVIYVI